MKRPFNQMVRSDSKSWDAAVREELGVIAKVLEPLGFSIDEGQPHLSGEGFLLLKEKLVLAGRKTAAQKRVIIKTSKYRGGYQEIEREKNIRDTLAKMLPADGAVLLPKEVYFGQADGYLVWVSDYIEQEQVFAGKPPEEQFSLVLKILGALENFRLDTLKDRGIVSGVFEIADAQTYIGSFPGFKGQILKYAPENHRAAEILSRAEEFMKSNRKLMEKYSGYLEHRDFAPANMRVSGQKAYLIDLSSMRFGNKYESWARFINWALLFSRELEKRLMDYVRQNRGTEEYLCLRLMRMYAAGYLLGFYAGTLKKISGNLLALNLKRLDLWSFILQSLLEDRPIPDRTIEEYWSECSRLRSKGEIERQKEINIPAL